MTLQLTRSGERAGWHQYAKQRGLTVEGARLEMAADLEQAIAWWQEFEADPARRAAVVHEVEERRRRAAQR